MWCDVECISKRQGEFVVSSYIASCDGLTHVTDVYVGVGFSGDRVISPA